jgi:hypothetical protein
MNLPPPRPPAPVPVEQTPRPLPPESASPKSLAPDDKAALAIGRPIVAQLRKNWLLALVVLATGGSFLRTGNAPENADKAIELQKLRDAQQQDRDAKLKSALERIAVLEQQTACYQKLFGAHFKEILPEPGALVWSPNMNPSSWQDSCAAPKP